MNIFFGNALEVIFYFNVFNIKPHAFVLLPQTNIEGAVRTGEKIRSFCATEKVKETNALVTVSIGGASLKEHQPAEPHDLISLADKALYVGKENARNQLVVL